MSSISGWQDSICYQLSFYAITEQRSCAFLLEEYCRCVREMTPYLTQWITLGGAMLSKILRPAKGARINEIRDKESLSLYFERLSELSAAEVDEMDLSPFATKLPRPFFASAKQLDRRWKEQAARFTDLKQLR